MSNEVISDKEMIDLLLSDGYKFRETIEKLQERVKELEELLAKEAHARSQANFAVVLLQERLKVFEEFCKEGGKP